MCVFPFKKCSTFLLNLSLLFKEKSNFGIPNVVYCCGIGQNRFRVKVRRDRRKNIKIYIFFQRKILVGVVKRYFFKVLRYVTLRDGFFAVADINNFALCLRYTCNYCKNKKILVESWNYIVIDSFFKPKDLDLDTLFIQMEALLLLF